MDTRTIQESDEKYEYVTTGLVVPIRVTKAESGRGWVMTAGNLIASNPAITDKDLSLAVRVLALDTSPYVSSRTEGGNKVFSFDLAAQKAKLKEELGMTPREYMGHWNRLQWEHWVAPMAPVLKRTARGYGGKWYCADIAKYWKHYDKVTQAIDDGLPNIAPVLVALTEVGVHSAQEASQLLGRSTWKTICNSSMHRNILLGEVIVQVSEWASEEAPAVIQMIVHNFPTTALKAAAEGEFPLSVATHQGRNNKALVSIVRDARSQTMKLYDWEGAATVARDCRRMCEEVGRKFNPKWSMKRMRREHDRASEELTAKKYPKTLIKDLNWCPKKVEYTANGVAHTATLLDTPYDIAAEGAKQHHCAASYVPYVTRGECILFNVVGKDDSTLEIKREGYNSSWSSPLSDGWRVAQNRRAWNKPSDNSTSEVLKAVEKAWQEHVKRLKAGS